MATVLTLTAPACRAGRVHDAGAQSCASSSRRPRVSPVARARGGATRSTALRALPPDAVAPLVAHAAHPELFELSLFGLANPFADAAKEVDNDLPGWFPAVSFAAYVLVTREVRKIRREQERKAMERATKAASEAAQRKVESIPPEAWAKLVVCLVIDGLGDSSFLFPGLGELSDAAYAPLEAFLLGQLFQSNAISGVGFVEEALPFTDVLPTATIAWVLEEFFADTWPGKALGLSSPRASRDEDEDDRDAKKK